MRYCSREDAETATKKLNNYQIRPGTFLAVTKSVDNRRLCLKTLPSLSLEITAGEVREELRGLLEGVEGVRFLSTKWLEVEFQSHRLAALARRQLLPGNLTIFRNVNIRQVRTVGEIWKQLSAFCLTTQFVLCRLTGLTQISRATSPS